MKACRFGAVERRIGTAQNRFPAQNRPAGTSHISSECLFVSTCKVADRDYILRATCARVLQGELYWWGEGMNAADKPAEDVAQELEVPERLPEEINPDILRKYFTLTASDLEQVEQCRGPINRLGFAVQLCTLRWRGHFLGDTRQVPESVLATIASQLGLDPTVVSPGAIWTEVKPGFPPISSSKRPHGLMTCCQIPWRQPPGRVRSALLQEMQSPAAFTGQVVGPAVYALGPRSLSALGIHLLVPNKRSQMAPGDTTVGRTPNRHTARS